VQTNMAASSASTSFTQRKETIGVMTQQEILELSTHFTEPQYMTQSPFKAVESLEHLRIFPSFLCVSPPPPNSTWPPYHQATIIRTLASLSSSLFLPFRHFNHHNLCVLRRGGGQCLWGWKLMSTWAREGERGLPLAKIHLSKQISLLSKG
jgi:hypothetical protein